jgi:hypothetical protein
MCANTISGQKEKIEEKIEEKKLKESESKKRRK